jgi:hypothetical protein
VPANQKLLVCTSSHVAADSHPWIHGTYLGTAQVLCCDLIALRQSLALQLGDIAGSNKVDMRSNQHTFPTAEARQKAQTWFNQKGFHLLTEVVVGCRVVYTTTINKATGATNSALGTVVEVETLPQPPPGQSSSGVWVEALYVQLDLTGKTVRVSRTVERNARSRRGRLQQTHLPTTARLRQDSTQSPRSNPHRHHHPSRARGLCPRHCVRDAEQGHHQGQPVHLGGPQLPNATLYQLPQPASQQQTVQ